MNTLSKQIPYLAVLSVIFLLQGFVLWRWMHVDTRTPAWDQATHTLNAYEFKDRIINGPLSTLFKPTSFDYPPLYYLQLIPFLNVVSNISSVGSIVNFFYLGVLIFSIFFIGQILFGQWEGLTAAIVFSCYPFVGYIARNTLIDLSLTAWVTLGFLCLLKSNAFQDWGWSIAFGIVLGFGMLTKWTALAYLIGPLGVQIPSIIQNRNTKKILIAFTLTATLMAPWYLTNFIPTIRRIVSFSDLPPANEVWLQGWRSIFWYPWGLNEQLNLPFLILFIPGLFVSIWRPKARIVLAWFLVSLILFTLINNRNVRYSLPALPAAALLTAAWLPPWKKIGYGLTITIASIFFYVFQFRWHTIIPVQIGQLSFWLIEGRPPFADDWQHQIIANKIRDLKIKDDRKARVVVVCNHPHFHSTSFNATMRNKNIHDVLFYGLSKRRWFEFADFILLKTGSMGPVSAATNVIECQKFVMDPPPWFRQTYKEVARWSLPEDSVGVLYQTKPESIKNVAWQKFNFHLSELVLPNILATDVDVSVLPISQENTQIGKFKEMTVSCKSLDYKSIRFNNVRIRLIEPQINLPLYLATGEIQLLHLKAMAPHAFIESQTLIGYAEKKAKWLQRPEINFDGSIVKVKGTAFIIPIEVALRVEIRDHRFQSQLLTLSLAKIPLPRILFKAMTNQDVNLRANDDLAYDLNIEKISGDGSKLWIGL